MNDNQLEALRIEILKARMALVEMLMNEDWFDSAKQQIVRETASSVSESISRLQQPPEKLHLFEELVECWSAFRRTRESELVPSMLAGELLKARHLATGIQKQRLDRCLAIIEKLADKR